MSSESQREIFQRLQLHFYNILKYHQKYFQLAFIRVFLRSI